MGKKYSESMSRSRSRSRSRSSSSNSRSSRRSRSSDSRGNRDDESTRTVFVNGLEYEIREDDIEKFFEECGKVEYVNLPKYQDSQKNIGYCHVRFETPEAAIQALSLNGKYLG